MSGEGSPVLLHKPSVWARQNRSSTRVQIQRFLFVGGSSVAIDLVVYMAIVGALGPLPAKAISYIAGMLFGFVGNKFWTFESRRSSIAEPFVYVVLYALTLAVNVVLNSLCIALLDHLYSSGQSTRILAFFIATGTTTVLNFVGLKQVAFRASTQSSQ